LLIVPAFALVLIFALLVTAIVRPPTRAAALLSVYLFAYANIVGVGEISNSFYQLNNPWLWVALHMVFAITAGLVWWRAGKPSLKAPWTDQEGRFLPKEFWRSWKRWPDLWVLTSGVALAFLFSAVLIWVVPPNNNDSLSTHMSRIGYWLQRGAFFPWPSQRTWQITYPVNMQLQIFWTVLFLRSDRIVEIVQWLGALAALAAVFGLARLLGASRPQALFAALLYATFPEIILESTTTQNDLVAGTLFAAMLYLLFLGLSRRNSGVLALSGLALGLGLGTKQTLLFLIPGLAMTLALILVYGRTAIRSLFRNLVFWGVSALVAFMLFGVYMFIVNQVSFGTPMGPETAVDAQTGGQTRQSLLQNLTFNTFRLAYQFIDPTGLPDPLCGYSFKLKGLVVGKMTQAIHFPVESSIAVSPGHQFVLRERYVLQEDAGWYGPLFALLVLPALCYQFYQGIRRKDALRAGIFVLALTFLLVDATFRPGWDRYQGRYFIPVVMIVTPMIAFFARPGRWSIAMRWMIGLLALVITTNTFLLGSGKPVSGEYAVWSTNRTTQMTIQNYNMRAPLEMVEAKIPTDATLGLLTFGSFQEYPFFREDFSRRLVQIYPPERIHDVNWLKAQGIEYVLVLAPEGTPPVNAPAELAPTANVGDWTLMSWKKPK
jgi:4-amino-4-deoxy-L-arabinose transferase-like glycosyltransferase